jgi:DNA-binding MarR family transcriptional regulator
LADGREPVYLKSVQEGKNGTFSPMSRISAYITPCNNGVVRQAARMLGQLYDDVLAPSGLRVTQHNLLYTIQAMDGPTLRAMAEALVMDLSALGHSLKPLVREGFVAIVPDSNDGRAKRATLTRGGIKKLKVTTGLWQQAQSRFDVAFGGQKKQNNCAVCCSVLPSRNFGRPTRRAGR